MMVFCLRFYGEVLFLEFGWRWLMFIFAGGGSIAV